MASFLFYMMPHCWFCCCIFQEKTRIARYQDRQCHPGPSVARARRRYGMVSDSPGLLALPRWANSVRPRESRQKVFAWLDEERFSWLEPHLPTGTPGVPPSMIGGSSAGSSMILKSGGCWRRPVFMPLCSCGWPVRRRGGCRAPASRVWMIRGSRAIAESAARTQTLRLSRCRESWPEIRGLG